jgi:hypothetical protein
MTTPGYLQRWRDKVKGTMAPDDDRHGTCSTYNNWGCRCAPCRDAQRRNTARYRAKKKAPTSA